MYFIEIKGELVNLDNVLDIKKATGRNLQDEVYYRIDFQGTSGSTSVIISYETEKERDDDFDKLSMQTVQKELI